ncbi:MAG: 2-amino-4-hydroxy-6-hydroxymethyldihydropteridine diphosphokinase [Elusimicrobia bacterium]|nr:2-amino-4-hydroxy-6-hydroxymethyldihydropteridine diphosphokinase [Elusimicrobiota bacterium]
MVQAFLLLGSNVGARYDYLKKARFLIGHWHQTTIESASSIWETAPMGLRRQRRFFNQALKIITGLSPLALLVWAKKTEILLGRRRRYTWGPREIDIDILLYGSRRLNHPLLALPHSGLEERFFALAALNEIGSLKRIPGSRSTVRQVYERAKKSAAADAAVIWKNPKL